MATLEQEVLDKFNQLDPVAKQRVKRKIQDEDLTTDDRSSTHFDFETWLARVDEIRERVRIRNGGVFPKMDVVQMLREIRDEDE